jgi:Zn-finger nucleic acid-binding protein
VLRVLCPACQFVFLLVAPSDDDDNVICPRCKGRFVPDEEELVDPEDD